MSVIALIPARSGSKGIPNKNFRLLPDGSSCLTRAVLCALSAGVDRVRVSTDEPVWLDDSKSFGPEPRYRTLHAIARPAELAQDDTPMVDVVKHALAQVPGAPDDVIVLLQPTQPLRTSEHVRAAIRLLQETGADSVVSVVDLPQSHHPDLAVRISNGRLDTWPDQVVWGNRTTCRQQVETAYRCDGTVYAFWRKTLDIHGTIYGRDVRPLFIPADESCELDTEADWAGLEQRIRDRMKQQAFCACETPQPYQHPSGRVICQNVSCGGAIVAKPEPIARP